MPTSKIRVAILASGSGTNAQNLLEHALENEYYQVDCVLTDQQDAGVIAKTERFNVDCFVVPFERNLPEETYEAAKKRQEQKILSILEGKKIEWIFLAGYMRILSSDFISKFWDHGTNKSKIINIHPSLLPAFPGANAYEQAWESGQKISGITVHHVDSGIDTGPIIMQEQFHRSDSDDFNSFKKKGMHIEYELYKRAVEKLFAAKDSYGQH